MAKAGTTSTPKAPILVIIFSWLLLISGILQLLVAVPLALFGGIDFLFGVGGVMLIASIGTIAVSSGIRGMRRWALDVFSVITVLSLGGSIYSYVVAPTSISDLLIPLALSLIVLAYLWSIHKKFA